MSDLTVGEIGKVLQLNLVTTDYTQNPPAQVPLDLTSATSVQLVYVITSPNSPVKAPTPATTKNMTIVSPPTLGIVSYTFQSGDLAQPPEMGKNGVFRFSIKVTFASGSILYSNSDGQLTVKEDATL